MGALSPKRQRFVQEYLVDLNATQSAIRAGYREKSAGVQGARLLANAAVQAEIKVQQQERARRVGITQDRVLSELAAIAFACGTDFTRVAPDGTLETRPTDQVPPGKLPAVAAMKYSTRGVEIKLYDKLRALELLAKHLGMFEKGMEIAEPVDGKIVVELGAGEELAK